MRKGKSEPFFHIAKRDDLPWQKAFGIRLVAIVLALILCGILTTVLTGLNPFSVYQSLFLGAFGTARKTWVTFQNVSILLIISLALTPAFKMRFWNIGGEGQVLVGGLATGACMITLSDALPNGLLIFVMLGSAILAGGIWGIIPALLKAKWNTNETLATLMMNYIATQLVAFFVIVWEVPKGSFTIGIINQSTNKGWLPEVGNKYALAILVGLLIALWMYVFLKYSKQGYEISVVGQSENTARYIGINVKNVIVRTMFLSGAICGIAGFLLVGGINHTITTTLAGGQGFTGVMVSWLANFNPIIMIFTSLLIVFMERGAGEISTSFGLNESYADILTGIILFFIIGSEFFIRYRLIGRKKGENAIPDESMNQEENAISDESMNQEENAISDESMNREENAASDKKTDRGEKTERDEKEEIE